MFWSEVYFNAHYLYLCPNCKDNILKAKFSILGNGSWSSALAKMLTDNGHSINWWMRSEEAQAKLKSIGHNPHYLTGVRFDTQLLHVHHEMEAAIQMGDYIIIGIPSAFVVDVLKKLPKDIFKGKKIVSAIKGILPNENGLLNVFLKRQFDVCDEDYVCISGPCHAEEVAIQKLSFITFASSDLALAKRISGYFDNHYIKTICSNDVYGVQYAAVLKNIYALGAGIAHGLDYGDNFLSVYITNCFAEMQQFIQTISSCHQHHYNTSVYLGDLLVTCYSLHSRNRTFGNFIGSGYSVSSAKLELNMVAEGYFASKGIYEICLNLNVQLPIAFAIYSILWEKSDAHHAFKKIENICQ